MYKQFITPVIQYGEIFRKHMYFLKESDNTSMRVKYLLILYADSCNKYYIYTSGVLEHKWRASLKTILFLYE